MNPQTLDDYQADAAGFDIGARLTSREAIHAMGLAGEAGEVVELLKKHLRDGSVLDLKRLREELGDVLWYVAQIASNYRIGLGEIAEANLAKLEKRRLENILAGRRDYR